MWAAFAPCLYPHLNKKINVLAIRVARNKIERLREQELVPAAIASKNDSDFQSALQRLVAETAKSERSD